MSMVAPSGPVYQAGTLSGNPLAMTAGIETLSLLGQPEVYSQLEAKSAALEKGMAAVAVSAGAPLRISRVGSILTAFFTQRPVIDYQSAKQADTAFFGRFFQQMLAEGIYWPPSQFEAAFVSVAHSSEDIQITVEATGKALRSLSSVR